MSTFASILLIFDEFLGIRLDPFYMFAINYFMTNTGFSKFLVHFFYITCKKDSFLMIKKV